MRDDPFGYEGKERDRPCGQARLILARRSLEAQEKTIGWHCKVDPGSLSYRYPVHPPTMHTRRSGGMFAQWVNRAEWLEDLKNEQRLGAAQLRPEWVIERDGETVELSQLGDLDQRVWVWWDAVAGLVGVDRHGRAARAR